MRARVKRGLGGPAVPILVCLLLGALGGVATALVTKPAPAQPVSFTPPRTSPPTYSLPDENGVVRTPASARGKVLMLTFIFTQCRSACPRISAEMRDAMVAAGDGVETHAISVDPENDTPEASKAWLRKIGFPAETSHVLIGSREELEPVWERFGIVPIANPAAPRAAQGVEPQPDQPTQADDGHPPAAALDDFPSTDDGFYRGRLRHGGYLSFEHSAYVLLIDKHGRQRVGFPFEQATSERILHDVRLLQAEV
jgi:protein SCO1/2